MKLAKILVYLTLFASFSSEVVMGDILSNLTRGFNKITSNFGVVNYANSFSGRSILPLDYERADGVVEVPPLDAYGVKKLIAGRQHSLALMTDGKVYAWGSNSAGELGLGDRVDRHSPTQILTLSDVNDIFTYSMNSFVVLSDGTVRGWGQYMSSTSPIEIPGLDDVVQIAVGERHFLALLSDGTVKAWGEGADGKLGFGSTSNVSIPTTIPTLSGVTQVAVGHRHSLALLEDGTVKSWGSSSNGQLGLGSNPGVNVPTTITSLSNIKQIVAYQLSSGAVYTDGRVRTWGHNYAGGLGLGSGTSTIRTPTLVSELTDVSSLVLGASVGSAVLADGTVRMWGNRSTGLLIVDPSYSSTDRPVPSNELSGVKEFSFGEQHALVVLDDGTLKVWGNNNSGRLGLGDTLTRTSPTTLTLE